MTEMLEGLMQNDFQLTLNHIRRRMQMVNQGAEVVTLQPDGSVTRISHAALTGRADRLVTEASEHVLRFDWEDIAQRTRAIYDETARLAAREGAPRG